MTSSLTMIDTRKLHHYVDAQTLQQALAPALLTHPNFSGLQVELIDSTASTNSDLLQRARQNIMASHATNQDQAILLLAEAQTAGRGRLGRQWHSQLGQTLTFSLALPWHAPLQQLSGASLLVGLALARTLQCLRNAQTNHANQHATLHAVQAPDADITLKWPNDVLYQGRKLSGILVEVAKSTQASSCHCVIGIGINLQAPAPLAQSDTTNQVLPTAGIDELFNDALLEPDSATLLAMLMIEILKDWQIFSHAGWAPFVEEWQNYNHHANRPVSIWLDGKNLHNGICRGINAQGGLLLETAQGNQTIVSGDLADPSNSQYSLRSLA